MILCKTNSVIVTAQNIFFAVSECLMTFSAILFLSYVEQNNLKAGPQNSSRQKIAPSTTTLIATIFLKCTHQQVQYW